MSRHQGQFSCTSVTGLESLSMESDTNVDDGVVIYVQAMKKPFDELCRAAAQLAGLLVLAAAGSPSSSADHPMLAIAAETYRWANEAVRAANVPPAGRHHHLHLGRAASWLGAAIDHCRSTPRTGLAVDGTLSLLRRCWRELRFATTGLPGFQLVAVDQACCGEHSARRNISQTRDLA